MSENSNTEEAFELNEPSSKSMHIFLPEAGVNAMLATLGGRQIFPDAADIDRIDIEVDHAPLMNRRDDPNVEIQRLMEDATDRVLRHVLATGEMPDLIVNGEKVN